MSLNLLLFPFTISTITVSHLALNVDSLYVSRLGKYQQMGIVSPLVGKVRAKVSICNMKRTKNIDVVVTLLDQALNLTVGSSYFTYF